ncbi:MLO-like protein 4 [Morella rubra]|uniref:MLO-like protein 4 n=1 Tax=Morella rubra TaxID=262757 RepID=A0A6A1V5F3_9ROSI|nr:MLO-like protein 4 [Morella rubra]
MGSRYKKALVAEGVRESLHSWCKRVKERSKLRDSLHSHAARSVCSLESTIDEITVASDTLSRSSSLGSLNQVTVASNKLAEPVLESSDRPSEYSFRVAEYLSDAVRVNGSFLPTNDEEENAGSWNEGKFETLLDLFKKT